MWTPGVIRLVALTVPALATYAAVRLVRPDRMAKAAAAQASIWVAISLLVVDAVATRQSWWSYGTTGGAIMGIPGDLYFGWILAWGALPLIAAGRWPLWGVVAVATAADLVLMPLMAPAVLLGDAWLVGEAVAIAVCLVPAQLLGRWTRDGQRLFARSFTQCLAFATLSLVVIPGIALEKTAGSVRLLRPGPWDDLAILCMVAAGTIGLGAVMEFALRGQGTPVPWDPPRRLVTSGLYAYVANPMQIAAVLTITLWGVVLGNGWVVAAAFWTALFAVSVASKSETMDLESRFGAAWVDYRSHVRDWWPRWRPWVAAPSRNGANPARPVARLYVDGQCGTCSELGMLVRRLEPLSLEIVDARMHPWRDLDRLTYDPGDGGPEDMGIAAFGRALEHVNLALAMVGVFLRLPGVRHVGQWVVDRLLVPPHVVARSCATRTEARAPTSDAVLT
jgi:protein-S-isoprenylcysteine O-methyltransferase Ste14